MARTGKRRRWPRFHLMGICALLLISLLAFADYLHYRERIYPGIQLYGLEAGGMSREGLEAELLGLTLACTGPGGLHARLPLQELGILVDLEETFAAAHRLGRTGPWPWRWGERLALYRQGASLTLHYKVNREGLSQSLQRLSKAWSRKPRDAYFEIDDAAGEGPRLPRKGLKGRPPASPPSVPPGKGRCPAVPRDGR